MAGWIPVPASLWAAGRESIGGRWPESLAVLDLRYFDDEIASGGKPRPSVRALADLWGWSRSSVSRLIADRERWIDVGHRRDTGGTPVGQSAEVVTPDPPDHGTAVGHPWDTRGTALRERRAGSPFTLHPSEDPSDPLVRSSDDQTGSVSKIRNSREREHAAALWSLWREQRRPAGVRNAGRLWHTSKAPSDAELSKLRKALQDRAKMHRRAGEAWPDDLEAARVDVADLIVAFHTGAGFEHWQGNNDRGTVYLGLGTLLGSNNAAMRWDRVQQWRDDGRPVHLAGDAPADPKTAEEARRAWPWLLGQIGERGGYLPEKLAENADVDAALWDGVKACGGIGAIQSAREPDRRTLSRRFVDAYTARRHLGAGRPPGP